MEIKILYEGEDITQLIDVPLSLTYSDKLDGETDDLQLTLADKDKKFLLEYFPKRGATVEVTIDSLELGKFEIDEVNYSCAPSVMKVKATSIPQLSGLRQTDMSKSWEHVKLSKIARDIAEASECELFFESDFDPEIERAEQGEQSRLAFLSKLCSDWGFICKFSDGKLIIYPEENLETREPVAELHWDDLTHFDATATLQEIYKDCQLNYKNGQRSELYSATATDDSKSTGKILKINKKVSSQAEAEHLARHELKKKNKHEWTATLTKRFDADWLAGNALVLSDDFGAFAGKWLIDEVTHSVGSQGSVSKCKAHKVQSSS